jgi:NAD(P)-dependent dehydrogenase (short-subunit alcohol dehydrogenase family)
MAVAQVFAHEGVQLVLLDRAPIGEAALVKLAPAQCLPIALDLCDAAQVTAAVEQALARFGRIDVFFANAGIEGEVAAIPDYSLEMYDRVMAVNVRGVWLGLRAVMPVMAQGGGGSIVITSSLAGLRGTPKLSAYTASKHAVVGLMKSAALEGAAQKIRVNTINPAPIATRMIESLENQWAPGASERMKARIEHAVPLRRYGQPEEVANLVLFLACDESSYITGNSYPVDGGMCAA